MHPLFERRLRPIAVLILVFFSWFCIEPWNFAVAAQTPPSKPPPIEKGASEKLEESLRLLKKLTREIDQDLAIDQDLQPKIDRIVAQQKRIADFDLSIQKEFADTETFLKAKNLPAVILDRHAKAVGEYRENIDRLRANLNDVVRLHGEQKRAKGKSDHKTAEQKRGELKSRLEAAKAHLEQKVKEPRHQKLDPNNLPYRTPKIKERKPRLKKEEFTEFQKPIQLAFNGDPSTLVLVQSTQDLPTPADLAENPEVQFTPAINALALRLENDPVKIYNWVRNNIEFVPTYGSIQGASVCLETKQCNDMDSASLLISLLRTSGISARYVTGTIQVPIDQIMNWAGGFSDKQSALNFFSTGGAPGTALLSGGQIVGARLEHIWVEAYVDYIPSKGAVHKTGDTWIPLDASFKQHSFPSGIDWNTAVPLDSEALATEMIEGATINPTAGFVSGLDQALIDQTVVTRKQELQDYILTNMPGARISDLIGRRVIAPQDLTSLPRLLPYKLIVRGSQFSEVPEALRHKIRFRVMDGFGDTSLLFEALVSELTGKRITLSYLGASPEDVQVLDVNREQIALPAYLMNVAPVLRVEGMEPKKGGPIRLGESQEFFIDFTVPNQGFDTIQHTITAGAYYAVGLDPQRVPLASLEQSKRKAEELLAQAESNPNLVAATDDVVGQALDATLATYFMEFDAFVDVMENILHVRSFKPSTAAGLVFLDVRTEFLFDVPFRTSLSGDMILDVDRIILSAFSRVGDTKQGAQFIRQSGLLASALESAVLEQLWIEFGIKGVSTAQVLAEAHRNNIPIYQITSQNVSQVLPLLSVGQAVKDDILNAANAGKEIIIPQREMTLDSWTGVGYIVADPLTGAGAYLISGGLAGGAMRLGLSIWLLDLRIWKILVPITEISYALSFTIAAISMVSQFAAFAERLNDIKITPNLGPFEQSALHVLSTLILTLFVGAAFYGLTLAAPVGLAFAVLGIIVSRIWGIVFNLLIDAFETTPIVRLWDRLRYAKRNLSPPRLNLT